MVIKATRRWDDSSLEVLGLGAGKNIPEKHQTSKKLQSLQSRIEGERLDSIDFILS